MTVYVDQLFTQKAQGSAAFLVGKRNDHQWCHMVADTDEELHAMALRIGMKRAWFQGEGTAQAHYDLTPGRRAAAVAAGAVAIDKRQLVEIIRARRAALKGATS